MDSSLGAIFHISHLFYSAGLSHTGHDFKGSVLLHLFSMEEILDLEIKLILPLFIVLWPEQ